MLRWQIDAVIGDVFAVTGYRKGCGKTSLCFAMAQQLSSQFSVCVVTTKDGDNGSEFRDLCRDKMGITAPSFKVCVTLDEAEDADIIIHDGIPSVAFNRMAYVVSAPLEDLALGITDTRNHEFRAKVIHSVNEQYEASVEFVEESELQFANDSERDLRESDWVVLRELEKEYLGNTGIGEARRLMREVKDRSWGNIHKF